MSYVAARREALDDQLRTGLGFISWNFDPFRGGLSNQALVSQTIYAMTVPYLQGQVVTNLGFSVGVAGVAANPAHLYIGLAVPVSTTSALLLMDSGNLNANAAWTSTGLRAAPLTSPFIIPFDGDYLHLILEDGAFATPLQLARGANNGAQVNGAGAIIYGTVGVGQTSLGAIGTLYTITAGSFNFQTFST